LVGAGAARSGRPLRPNGLLADLSHKQRGKGRAAADPYDQTGCSASKRAIGDKLKSPGSAKWVSCQVTTEAGVQNVRLVVDSQNAFGGLVRTEWMTRVRNNNVESVDQFR